MTIVKQGVVDYDRLRRSTSTMKEGCIIEWIILSLQFESQPVKSDALVIAVQNNAFFLLPRPDM